MPRLLSLCVQKRPKNVQNLMPSARICSIFGILMMLSCASHTHAQGLSPEALSNSATPVEGLTPGQPPSGTRGLGKTPASPEKEEESTRPWLVDRLSFVLAGHAPLPAFLEPLQVETRGVWTQPTLSLTTRLKLWKQLGAELTLYGYPMPDARERWTPDFSYRVGWQDWRPFWPSLTHASYTSNRFPWKIGQNQPWLQPLKGVNTLSFRMLTPSTWRIHPLRAQAVLGVQYVPLYDVYVDEERLGEGWHQVVPMLSVGGVWGEHLFAMANFHFYPLEGQQQPWDPDITYQFGWMEWQPWRLSVLWANYSGTHWWYNPVPGSGGLLKGALTVALTMGFQ